MKSIRNNQVQYFIPGFNDHRLQIRYIIDLFFINYNPQFEKIEKDLILPADDNIIVIGNEILFQ